MPRLPGHREGIRRHQRYGQLALELGRTLAPEYVLSVETVRTIKGEDVEVEIKRPVIACFVCDDRGCEFCPKV